MTTQSDWIEWKGGEQPVPDKTRVGILFRDGTTTEARAQYWDWDRGAVPCDDDIVGYRVLDAKAGDRS